MIEYENNKITTKIYYWLSLSYFAILPMSQTIALRNLFLLILVSILVLEVIFFYKAHKFVRLNFIDQVPLALVVWIVYLTIFPLFAAQGDIAWINLKGQWFQSILAFVVGLGAVMLLRKQGPGLWALAFASSFPIVIHLILVIFAWLGLLGIDFPPFIPVSEIWMVIAKTLKFSSLEDWNKPDFPWGFWGIEPLHINLGYAACQSIALYGVCFYCAWRERDNSKILVAILCIAFCFLSILVAGSRGAFIYGIFLLVVIGFICFFKFKNKINPGLTGDGNKWGLILLIATTIFFSFLLFTTTQSFKNDMRWHTMVDKLKIGFQIDNPTDFLCNGMSNAVEAQIREQFSSEGQAYSDALIDGLITQDGARIILMRAGLNLLIENPLGLDGSRDSYKKIIEKKCGHLPVLQFAHAHQGWLDISLALGVVGTMIFAWMMIYFLNTGLGNMSSEAGWPWAFLLFLISLFWMSRGFADSVYREHYLQMQAFMLAYLFFKLKAST